MGKENKLFRVNSIKQTPGTVREFMKQE